MMRGDRFVIALLLLAIASQGAVGWITWINDIHNDASQTVYIKSNSHAKVGQLIQSGPHAHTFTLDNHQWNKLPPKTHYVVRHCGIPWYPQGLFFSFDRGVTGGLMVSTNTNHIEYYDLSTYKLVHKQKFHLHHHVVSLIITKDRNGKIKVTIN